MSARWRHHKSAATCAALCLIGALQACSRGAEPWAAAGFTGCPRACGRLAPPWVGARICTTRAKMGRMIKTRESGPALSVWSRHGHTRQSWAMGIGETNARAVGHQILTVHPGTVADRYPSAGSRSGSGRPVLWTHFLEFSALRSVTAVSPVEEKLAEWRAGSLAAGAVADGSIANGVFETHKQHVMTGMKWERVLMAEIGVGLKLSLWKSQARAKRMKTDWSVRNAILSLDFERSEANVAAFRQDGVNDGPPNSCAQSARGQSNAVPSRLSSPAGRSVEGRVSRRTESSTTMQRSSRGTPSVQRRRVRQKNAIESYVREMAGTEEANALIIGKRLLDLMSRDGIQPTTIFFNALLGACTGKSVAKGVGIDGRRGRNPKSTPHPPASGAAFTVRRRSSTSASRARTAAGRAAHERWSDCSQALMMMKGHKVWPDTSTLNLIVDACVKQGGVRRIQAAHVEQGLRILDSFSKSCSVAPDVVTYTSLLNGCAMTLRNCRGFALSASEEEERAVQRVVKVANIIVNKMSAKNIAPNTVTCTAVLDLGLHIIKRSCEGSRAQLVGSFLCQDAIALARLQAEGRDDQNRHQRFLTYALNVVLRALLSKGESDADCASDSLVLEVADFLLDEGALPDVITYNTLLHGLLISYQKLVSRPDLGVDGRFGTVQGSCGLEMQEHVRHISSAKELVADMYEGGVPPDVATYTTLLNMCAAGAPGLVSFVKCAGFVCAAMRCEKVKPNTATSTAFAAGLLRVAGSHPPCAGMERECADVYETLPMACHAAAVMVADGRSAVERGRQGPHGPELIRAMLALNMRPDAGTTRALIRATASGVRLSGASGENTAVECVRLIEAMRGVGAIPSREWYLGSATAGRSVTEGLYLAQLGLQHTGSSSIQSAVCEKLVHSFCRRRDFEGIAHGWAVVLRQRAAGCPVPAHLFTELLETARLEGSTTSAKLSFELLAAFDSDSDSCETAPTRVPKHAKELLVEVLRAAGMSEEASLLLCGEQEKSPP